MDDINTAILERLERVVDTLQDNSVKMGQLLAVHDEKLDKQDRIDAVLFEKIESVHRVEHFWCSCCYIFRRVSSRTKSSWCSIDTKRRCDYNTSRDYSCGWI